MNGNAESSRARAGLRPDAATARAARLLALGVVVGLAPVSFVEYLFLPDASRVPSILVTILIGAGCAVALVLVGSTSSWRRLVVPAMLLIDLASVVAAGVLPSALDVAVVVPILAAILVVSILDGWPMRIGLAGAWLSGIAGSYLARSSPGIEAVPNVAPIGFSVSMLGLGTGLGYLVLAWAAHHWRASIAERSRAAEAARLAEEAASRALERLRLTVETSPLPTFTCALGGRITSWNQAAEHLLGWTREEALAMHIVDMVPRDMREQTRDRVERAREGHLPGPRISTFLAKDGREVRAEIHDALELDDENRLMGVVVQFLDVTERESIATRLVEAQRLEAVGQLAGGVAHDFNNSLTAIAGFASLIASGDSPDPAEDARTILSAAEHAATLTRQLLAFSRRVPLNAQLVDLRAFLLGVEPLIRSLVGETIQVRVESGIHPALADVDPPSLEQAILNLAANARDAMAQGGELTLSVELFPNCLPSQDADSEVHVAIVVGDTGSGIPPSAIERVFEPFFTTKAPGKGTGLGLAMVHGFVAQSGGHVVVSSPPGQGATFELHFPRAAGVIASAAGHDATVGGNESILFVEDDPGVASFGLACLRRLGYDVTPAMNGSEAVALAASREQPFDLLLTDVVIPGMSGPELAALIHRHHPETAILYSSGYGPDQLSEVVADSEAPLLEKPYSLERLAAKVRESLGSRRI